MIDPVVSLQPATHRQYFMLALSLPLRWLRVTVVLNTMIALRLLHMMNVRFSLLNMVHRILGVTLPNF